MTLPCVSPAPIIGLTYATEAPSRVSRQIIQGAGHALAALLEHMRVDHRGGDIGMAQEFLDGSDVCAPLQEVRRKTVPEGVRADDLGQGRPAYRHFDGLVH